MERAFRTCSAGSWCRGWHGRGALAATVHSRPGWGARSRNGAWPCHPAHPAKHVWTSSAFLLIALAASAALGQAPARADDVAFGDAASEKAHAVSAAGTVADTGGLGQPCRRIEGGGALVFQLQCDPDAQNYLTVKFWGSDRDVATLFLFDGDKRIGEYLGAWPELDLSKGEAAFPGRFYYATCMLPREMTRGRQTATVKLAAVGSINPYAEPGKRERPLQGRTRGIYRAYCHTDPFFVPGPDEKQGEAPAARVRPPAEAGAAPDPLRREVDEGVARLLRWQLHGPEWDAAVAKGDAPAAMTGAVLRPTDWRKLAAEGWKDAVAKRATDGNATALDALAIFAKAYRAEWSRHHANAEMLDRVAQGLDFCCLLQGSNGGFLAKEWRGAPDRKPAGSCLEGFGTAGLGQALVLVHEDLAAKGLLDREVDADGDPATPAVPRRAAWAEMFARHRDYLVSREGRGHATNQDLAQMTAMWLANESLRALAPDRAWPREKALEYVREAVGLRQDPLGGYWVTRKGLALEPWGTLGGGYCGNYGLMGVGAIGRLAELTGDPQVRARAAQAVRAAAYFIYPSINADGYRCMRREEVISARNNNWPGRVDYGGNDFAAAVLREPLAVRAAQRFAADGNARSILEEGNAHFVAGLEAAVMNLEHALAIPAIPPAAARLPMEDGQPDFAWADEQAAAVAVRDRGARLYMALNWRRGFKGNQRDPEHATVNNIARVHCTTPAVDRIATLAMESPHGFGGLYVCRYGDYLVGMNGSEDATYDLPLPPGAAAAVDLVSRKACDGGAGIRVPPLTTVVLRLGDRK